MVAKHLVLVVGKEAPVAEEATAIEAAVVSGPQLVELLGRLHRQRAQHDLIDQREDGGGCADTQRQRQHGGQRKAWCAAKLPQSVTNILHDLLDELHESSSLWSVVIPCAAPPSARWRQHAAPVPGPRPQQQAKARPG